MSYTLTARWTTNCVPQEPVELTQGEGVGVPANETPEAFEERFDAAVARAQEQHQPDAPGACP